MTDRNRRVRRSVGVLLVLGAVAGLLGAPASRLEGLAGIRGTGPVLLALLGVYLVRPFVLGPMSVITVFVGVRFGLELGFPVAMAGTAITTLPPYLIADRLPPDSGLFGSTRRVGRDAVAATGPLRGMVAARLSPAPADPVSYGAGLAGVPLGSYVLGTLLGEVPWAVLFLLVGDSLRRFAVGSARVDPRYVAAMAVLSVALVAPPAVRYGRAYWRSRDLSVPGSDDTDG